MGWGACPPPAVLLTTAQHEQEPSGTLLFKTVLLVVHGGTSHCSFTEMVTACPEVWACDQMSHTGAMKQPWHLGPIVISDPSV